MIITPTIGCIVWHYPNGPHPNAQPWAAIVTDVHNRGTYYEIDITAFPPESPSLPFSKVRLIQEGELPEPLAPYCAWMPYQLDQAKRHSVDPEVLKHAAYNDLSGER